MCQIRNIYVEECNNFVIHVFYKKEAENLEKSLRARAC